MNQMRLGQMALTYLLCSLSEMKFESNYVYIEFLVPLNRQRITLTFKAFF